jgi:hypothetical protein
MAMMVGIASNRRRTIIVSISTVPCSSWLRGTRALTCSFITAQRATMIQQLDDANKVVRLSIRPDDARQPA